MNIYDNRLQSFHNNQRKWPHKGRLSAETLARSGFYFSPAPSRVDNVVCFLCDARLDRWRNDGDPLERHRRMAPDCPWVILAFPHTQHALPMPDNPKSTRLSSARVRTFKKNTQWPPKSMARKQLPTAKKLAESGFYYAPTKEHIDRVACAHCLATVTGMDRSTDLLAQHAPSCIFFVNKNVDSSIHGPVTRQQLRASKAQTPPTTATTPAQQQQQQQPQSSEHVAAEQQEPTLPSKKHSASIDDSIWDIGKAYAQRDHVVFTYSKKVQQQQELSSILPKQLTEPIARPPSAAAASSSSSSPSSTPAPEDSNNRARRQQARPQQQKKQLRQSDTPPPQAKKAPKRKLDKGKEKAVPKATVPSTTTKPSSSSSSSSATKAIPSNALPPPSSPSITTLASPVSQQQQQQQPPSPLPPAASSTPVRIDGFDDDNDLESLTLSPIRPLGNFRNPLLQGIRMQSTPNTQVSRIKRSGILSLDDVDLDGSRASDMNDPDDDPRKRLKPFSPPSSPTRRANHQSFYINRSLWMPEERSDDDDDGGAVADNDNNKNNNITSANDIIDEDTIMQEEEGKEEQKQHKPEEVEHVYEPLTEEHLNMTVEEYINLLVNKEIEKIKSNGDALIEQLESTVNRIRNNLTSTSSSS